jgi:asparagine synthase (glutamine-hydrolysing)
MAHGLESRVPLLDHPLVEFTATIPADSKFRDGEMKHIFKRAIKPFLPDVIYNRTDKMGFPTPLNQWIKGEARDFVGDILTCRAALDRELINNRLVMEKTATESKFGRNVWGLLSLELWQQAFHDREHDYKKLLTEGTA